MRGIHVLVADQHRTFAEAISARLAAEPDLVVSGAVTSAAAARGAVARDPVDVVLLDAGLDGLHFGVELRAARPRLRVVLITEGGQAFRMVDALRAGMSAWVGRDQPVSQLLTVIRGVAGQLSTWSRTGNGGPAGASRGPADPQPAGGAAPTLPPVPTVLSAAATTAAATAGLAELTEREREVLCCMVSGLNRAGIAARLGLSPNTVRTHTQHILGKLGVHSAVAAAALARQAGVGGIDMSGGQPARGPVGGRASPPAASRRPRPLGFALAP